jgi:sugar O-acyltransferase (sialic acid O-acetyltransferase NeuD family)
VNKVLVYGCAEFGQVVRNLVECCGYEFSGFIDDAFSGMKLVELVDKYKFDPCRYAFVPYERAKFELLPKKYAIAIAVGYKSLKARWDIYQKVKADGYKVSSLVHPQAIVGESAKIGEGVIIMAGAIVDYNVGIKDLAVLWNGAVVSHDSVIGENTFLSPNCTVCGCSAVGRDCFIGAGAVVTDHAKVTDGSFVKAGETWRISAEK